MRAWKIPLRRHARGLAVLVTLLLVLGVGVGLVTSGVTRTVPLQARVQTRAIVAMVEARQALIGHAVANDSRPGALPCPDALTNVPGNVPDDGIADVIVSLDGHCPSYIGRLPWKTLGLPDIRDENGERLWYALSPKYRDHSLAEPINSDTPSRLVPPPFAVHNDRVVYANSDAETLAAQAIAIVFSPGAPLTTQRRDATVAPCPATGTTLPRSQCASNYLEATGGADNASPAGPYVVAAKSATFNDRLSVLTAAELMPHVEMRVAAELRAVLIEYKTESNCQCYPWPADVLGVSRPWMNRGQIPFAVAAPENWGQGDVPLLPPWFNANNWGDVIYYTVGQTALQNKGELCTTCRSPTLLIDGVGGYSSLFFLPGPARGVGARARWSGYIDDPANADDSDDNYVTPSANSVARDRLTTMAGASPLLCEQNAQLLFENAPCQLRKIKGYGNKKRSLKPQCTYAAQNLKVCTCAAAAQNLLEKPCSKKIKKSECKAAVTTLKTCTA